MKLRTMVRDGLYLNWALPLAALPAPPSPLRYEVHRWQGDERVFASALLFRQQGLHLPLFPLVRLSYPQLNLRLYVVDGDGVPSVLFCTVLVPGWVVPAARLVGRQPASPARLRFPRPSRQLGAESWLWRVRRRRAGLEVEAGQGPPVVGEGPELGSWDETVRYFRERRRGYAVAGGKLRRVETEHPRVAAWPVTAAVSDRGLLGAGLGPGMVGREWPPLHSAWLCPEIPFTFELSVAPKLEMPSRVPQAAASSRSRL
jgi:hypothetical protein